MVRRYDCLQSLVKRLDNELVVTTLGALLTSGVA